MKNKQVDISTTFCFSETISWLCDFSDYPDHDEATAVPNSKDATLTILVSEADTTAYHEETIAESHDTLQSELEEVYKKKTGREIKENWTCLKNQKCWSLLIRSKNCFQRLVVRVVVPFL